MSGLPHRKPSIVARACMALCLTLAVGCAGGPYEYGRFEHDTDSKRRAQVVVDVGQPHKRLDRMSDVVSWPARTLARNKPDKRVITPETTKRVTTYLEKNDLADVYVSVRDYQPKDQWRRLRTNKQISPLLRYSLGSLSVARYAMLPGRVFGRNAYNPYTNTLYVNSDRPAAVLHEAALAKNMRSRPLPGAYAAMSAMPIVSVWPALDGASDVLGYARAESDWELEQDAYRHVYPHVASLGANGASTFLPVWWGGPALGLGGAAVGEVAGQAMLARRESQRKASHIDDEHPAQQASWSEPRADVESPTVKQAFTP